MTKPDFNSITTPAELIIVLNWVTSNSIILYRRAIAAALTSAIRSGLPPDDTRATYEVWLLTQPQEVFMSDYSYTWDALTNLGPRFWNVDA
jgi:hypothetical protein